MHPKTREQVTVFLNELRYFCAKHRVWITEGEFSIKGDETSHNLDKCFGNLAAAGGYAHCHDEQGEVINVGPFYEHARS